VEVVGCVVVDRKRQMERIAMMMQRKVDDRRDDMAECDENLYRCEKVSSYLLTSIAN
jgi:hypothetical protein